MDDVSKAKAVKDTRGLVQVGKRHEADDIVGVHMVEPRAADMIPEATLAVKFGLTVDDVIDTRSRRSRRRSSTPDRRSAGIRRK